MFHINRYRYIGKGIRFEIYARTAETADKLIARINAITDYKLRRKWFGFCKHFMTDTPPYEIEQAQEEGIVEMEEAYAKEKLSKCN